MTATAVLRGAEILSPAVLRVADSRSPLVFASCDLGHRAGFVPVRLNVALFAVPKVHGVRCARRVRWAGGNGLPDVLLDSPRPRGMQKAAWQGCDCSRSPVNPGTVPEAGAGKPPEAGVALAADSVSLAIQSGRQASPEAWGHPDGQRPRLPAGAPRRPSFLTPFYLAASFEPS